MQESQTLIKVLKLQTEAEKEIEELWKENTQKGAYCCTYLQWDEIYKYLKKQTFVQFLHMSANNTACFLMMYTK